MNKENTIYVFIDASNVWNAIKSVKKFIEYRYKKQKPPSIKRVVLGCITLTVLWIKPKDIISIASTYYKSISYPQAINHSFTET